MPGSYTEQLRERVEARHGPISQIAVPETREQALELAKRDPDQFNALVDAGRLPAAGLFASGDDDAPRRY